MRHLLGVPEEESLQHYVEERGVRAVRSLERVLQGLGIAPPPRTSAGDAAGERVPRPEPRKFDLGPGVDRGPVRENIPWGYGEDRITAMPVDPDRIYVYWEVTDAAIEAARRGLGDAGGTAWLSLRVHDVTGRIFDGTNAHACFDHRVERHDRQWFFSLGRPGSTVCVDVGMKSIEGYFVRIARSGRVDLPRGGEAPPAPVEWMTVRALTGEVEESHTGAPAASGPEPSVGNGRSAASPTATAAVAERGAGARVADEGARRAVAVNGWFEGAPDAWHGLRRRTEWVGDVERTSWQAGPFPYAVTPPAYEVTEERSGETRTVATPQGAIVVEQPWSVTIRGIGAHLSRRVLARWEIVRAIESAVPVVREVDATPPGDTPVGLGGSESIALRGASEQRLAAGSELRLGGASEEFLVGASELRFGGASDRIVAGASESRWAGASERRWLGASELAYAGASERLVRGASEERLAGGVPGWKAGGASELRIGGSEQRLGGASEDRLAPHDAAPRSARASWQAFAAAGTRLVTTQPGSPTAPGASRQPATRGGPDGTSGIEDAARAPQPAEDPRGARR